MSGAQKYTVLRHIGEGGMAEVFLAEMLCQPGYSKRVAVKRVLPRLARNARFMRMFLDEARLGLLLNHSNIVQVFDVGRSDDAYFIVMEYVDGVSLRQVWECYRGRGTTLPIEVSLAICIQICAALQYAHQLTDGEGRALNVVHHDVNPSNVLLSTSGECKLMDFGLAEAALHVERSDPDVVRGKFGYISPEVAHGQRADARSDLYSLGIVLWELCTGQRLFEGEDDLHSLRLAQAGQAPPLRSVCPELPPALEDVLCRALARAPEQRFREARQLANRLTEILFDLGRPVNSFTIGGLVQLVRDDARPERSDRAALIDNLIEDELAHFESLHYDQAAGGRPLWSPGRDR